MSLCETNNLYFSGNTLADDTLDAKARQMWSRKNFNSTRFYSTGFETILFNKASSFVLDVVLTSSVSWENEMLIVGHGSSLEQLKNIADNQNMNYYCIDWFSDKWSSVEQIIASHPDISHILIGLDSETQIENIPVNKLQSVVSEQKQSLIVYCNTQVEGINDLFAGAIDFMIAGIDNEPLCSFVVARRSKLVQTEGRSCSFCLDLYSYWQWSMRNRESVIEPMRI